MAEATYEAGYGSSSRVYEKADRQLGMTPATYGRGGKGMRIAYGLAQSSLGRVLIAATERGISAVYLGDDDRALEAALHEEYPAAETRRYDAALGPWLASVLKMVEGERPSADLPLDVQATAFQWRVWQALREIPKGETRSYARGRRRDRRAHGRARRGSGLRHKPRLGRHPLPPRGRERRLDLGLPLGRRAQEGAAEAGGARP